MLKTIKSVVVFPQVIFALLWTVCPRVSKQILNFGLFLHTIFMVTSNCLSCSFVSFWFFFLQMSHIQLWVLFCLSISLSRACNMLCKYSSCLSLLRWDRRRFPSRKTVIGFSGFFPIWDPFYFYYSQRFFSCSMKFWSESPEVALRSVCFPKEIFQSSSGLVLPLEMMG